MKIENIKAMLNKMRNWLKKPIQQQAQSLSHRYYVIENFLFKTKYSLDFDGLIPCSQLTVKSVFSQSNATAYEAYGNNYFKSLIRQAISMEVKPNYFIDIGCGKGKQCIYAKKYFNFNKIIGIDFSKELIDIANQNTFHLKYKNIDFLIADAIEWRLPNEYCFIFLYNPFNELILEKFISNNISHFKKHGSIICYANDLYRKVLTNSEFDVMYRDHECNSIYKLN